MDSDKRGIMSVTIAIFSNSVPGNTVNDTAGFSSTNTLCLAGCDRILLFCPWAWMNFFLSVVVVKALKIP